MKRLLVTIALVIVVWVGLTQYDSGPRNRIDAAMLGMIVVTFSFAAVVMLIGKQGAQWSARATGLLLTTVATAYLYGISLYSQWIAERPVGETAIDLLRSLYIVGGPLLAYGLITWVWVRWRVAPVAPSDATSYYAAQVEARHAEDMAMRSHAKEYGHIQDARYEENKQALRARQSEDELIDLQRRLGGDAPAGMERRP